MPDSSKSDGAKSYLQPLRDVALMTTAYLYFAGFLYEYRVRERLRLPDVGDLAVPKMIAFSYDVVKDWLFPLGIWLFGLGALTVVAAGFVRHRFRNRGKLLLGYASSIFRIAIGATGLILFPIIATSADRAAQQGVEDIRCGTKRVVQFTWKPKSTKTYSRYVRESNKSFYFRLLTEDDKSYFVLSQQPAATGYAALPPANPPVAQVVEPTKGKCGVLPPANVYRIRKDDVDYVSRRITEATTE